MRPTDGNSGQREVEAMNPTQIDEPQYQNLLATVRPVDILSDEEYQRLLDVARELMETPEEDLTEAETGSWNCSAS